MEKLQYDSFYKFLISLGIILIAAPVIGIFSLIKISNQLLITNIEYSQLSAMSLQIIEKRNYFFDLFFTWMPFIFGILIFVGFILLIYGSYKWRTLQKEFDEQTTLNTKEKRLTIEKMTTTEVVEKAFEEAVEKDTKLYHEKSSILQTIQTESLCFQYLKEKLPKYYEVQENVKAADTSFDMIAISSYQDILYEVKFWRKTPDFTKFKQALYHFQTSCTKYSINVSKKVKAKFIVLIPNSEYDKIHTKLLEYEKRVDLGNVKMEYYSQVNIECNEQFNKKN